ncbi:monocarboxylate transporter 12 [Trichonephila inaurata madagascariensis]|uniref:Monocarboxylate transporter 12 n=1 Tax=Trichonephila inaurata madagascariensis TaxID=2747483 RepID=A0A8X7BZU1_9ARAC|nr:monocarboxylate transporter 12 [Trichonephila inaurata madagascariensis]
MPPNSGEIITPLPDPNIDGGWGWAIVVSTFTMRFIIHGIAYSTGIYFVELCEYFHTTSGAASLVMSILLGMLYGVGPIASALISKYSCRTTSLMGAAISCIGLLLSLAAPSIEYLYLTIGLMTGLGFGLLFLPTITSVALHFEKKRATAMGISSAGSGIGSLLLVPFTEWLLNYYQDWKATFLITTGIVMQCFVLSLFYCTDPFLEKRNEPTEDSLDEPKTLLSSNSSRSFESIQKADHSQDLHTVREKKINLDDSEQNATTSSMMPEKSMHSEVKKKNMCLRYSSELYETLGLSLMKDYVFLIFSLSRLLQYLGAMTPSVYLYHRATELGIATSIQASFLMSLIGASNIIGKIVLGIFADLTSWNVLYTYKICLLINGISTMMTSLITHYYTMAIYSFVFGFTKMDERSSEETRWSGLHKRTRDPNYRFAEGFVKPVCSDTEIPKSPAIYK